MNIIAAVDKNWAIGKQGGLLVSIPDDMKLFREETLGKVVVMGRKTLESLPGGQPLYGRTNIVLTSDKNYKVKGAIICHSLKEALWELEKYPSEDVFIAGGQSIYEQFLPYCNIAHITWIDFTYEADTWMENLDKHPQWKMILESEEQTYFNLCYSFRMYKRVKQTF